MRRKFIFKIVLCSIMAALAIVLEKFSFDITNNIKITLYAIPLIVVAITNGPIYGIIAGVVTGMVSQLTSKYGISLTSFFWGLAPVMWGGISGLVSLLFKKKKGKIEFRIACYIIGVIFASIFANLTNTFAMLMDTLLIKDSWYTTSSILLDWPPRIITMLIAMVPYILICGGACEGLYHALYTIEKEELK